MNRLMLSASIVACTLGVTLLGALPAEAGSTVRISSGGLSRISTYTWRPSTTGYITYTVTDRQRLGRQVSQCNVSPTGRRQDCDTYPLRNSRFRDGNWRIRQVGSRWQIRVAVAWDESSPRECMSQHAGAGQWGVQIGILGRREQLLARRTHSYTSICQGFAAAVSGGGLLLAHPGRDSSKLRLTYTVVDPHHTLKTTRRCFHDPNRNKDLSCREGALQGMARQTPRGWTFTMILSWAKLTTQQCQAVHKVRPDFQYNISFRNARGVQQAVTRHSFTLNCTG